MAGVFQEVDFSGERFDGKKYTAKGTTFHKFFQSLKDDSDIKEKFLEILKKNAVHSSDSTPKSYFFETPRMEDIGSQDFEFVLLDAPGLSSRKADSGPFMEHFQNDKNDPAVTFPSLGGDARLVAPTPIKSSCNYNDLASFMRTADHTQINGFWKKVANVALKENKDFAWMSTAGQGVPWLHLRFDTRPKYYTYWPYTIEKPLEPRFFSTFLKRTAILCIILGFLYIYYPYNIPRNSERGDIKRDLNIFNP